MLQRFANASTFRYKEAVWVEAKRSVAEMIL